MKIYERSSRDWHTFIGVSSQEVLFISQQDTVCLQKDSHHISLHHCGQSLIVALCLPGHIFAEQDETNFLENTAIEDTRQNKLCSWAGSSFLPDGSSLICAFIAHTFFSTFMPYLCQQFQAYVETAVSIPLRFPLIVSETEKCFSMLS